MKYLIFLLLPTLASATLNNVDKAFLITRNQLGNPGFESGKNFWTASAGTFSTVISGSNLLEGGTSVTWDAAAAADTLSSALTAIPNGLYGKPGVGYCTVLTPSGTATHTLEIHDGTSILATLTVASNTSPVKSTVHFLFPTSGSLRLRLQAQANEPLIAIDDCYLGAAEGVSLVPAKPQDTFSADISGADAVSNENVDWINGNCTDATTGEQTCTFNSGIFTATPNCVATGVTDGNTANISAVSSTSVTIRVHDGGGTATNNASKLMCQKATVDSPSVSFKPDTLANSWSGYHDDTCSWARTSTTMGDPTADATCSLVEINNQNFGTVSDNASDLPGITFTPKRAGRYLVKAGIVMTSSGSQHDAAQLTDGTTVYDTCLGTTAVGNSESCTLVGIVVATSTSAVSLRIQTASSAGSNTLEEGAVNTGRSINWSVVGVDQAFPSPLLSNSVVTSSSGVLGFETAKINCDAGSAVTEQNGTWISSIGNISSGACAITIATGVFRSTPTCFTTNNDTNGLRISTVPASATSVSVPCLTGAGANCSAYDASFMCVGPR